MRPTYPCTRLCRSWGPPPGRRLAGVLEELGKAEYLLLVFLGEVLRRPEQRAHRVVFDDWLSVSVVEPVERALVEARQVTELQAAHLAAPTLHRRDGCTGHAERLSNSLLREPQVLAGLPKPCSHRDVLLVILVRVDECLRSDRGVGQAHADRPHSEVVGAVPRAIMQDDMWLTMWRGQHLNLLPAETTKSGTEHLRNSLFRCEAGGETAHAAGTERDLLRCEGALEEPIPSDVDSP